MKIDDYNKTMARLEISSQCEERIMDMIKEKKITRHVNKKAIVISVLAAALACGGIGAAAAFGGLRRNQEIWQQEREHVTSDGEVYSYSYEKFDHNNYDMLQSAAEVIPEGEATTKTDNISVTAEDVYCDGRNLVCTFKAVTDQTEAMVLHTVLRVTINGQEYRFPTLESGLMQIKMIMLADQTEPGVYYGTLNFRIPEELTETPEISVTCRNFQCYDSGIVGRDSYVGTIPEKVTIAIPVTLQKDLLHDTKVGYAGDALQVLSVETSPAGIGVTYHYDLDLGDWIKVFDENGNEIKRKEDGYLRSGNLYDIHGNIVEGTSSDYVYTSDWLTEFFEATDTDSITVRLVNTLADPNAAVDEVTVSLND